MKFSVKLVLGTIIIISILFSAGGTILIRENFEVAYDQAVEQNIRQHILSRYSFESGIRSTLEQNNELSNDIIIDTVKKMTSYGTKSTLSGVIIDGSLIYSDFSKELLDEEVEKYYNSKLESYLIKEENDNVYMYLASEVEVSEHTMKLMNIYDLSSIFEERDRQNEYYVKWFLILLVTSIVSMIVFSKIITAPIKQLNESSKRIAKGQYRERTKIKNNDEIGELSESFDTMVNAVELHIETLKEDIKNREAFISDFSHELKTPMTSMMGYSKLLLSGECDGDLQKKCAGYIYSECHRLELLSRKLLCLMEIDENPIELVSVSTKWLKEKIEVVMQPFLEDQDIDWQNKWDMAYIYGDGQLLLDYLKNVIENGIKASKERPVIVLNGKQKGHKYHITVTDYGCGLNQEELEKICNPFYTVDKSRAKSQGGTGLGLSICNKIAAVHHTTMEITSKPGAGTTITMVLEVNNEKVEIL